MDLELDLPSRRVGLRVQKSLYPFAAVEAAATAFRGRAAVFVEDLEGEHALTLEAPASTTAGELEALAGDFLNELLGSALRQRLLAENKTLNDYLLTRACLSALRDPADPLQPPEAADAELNAEQRAEARRLADEAEAEVRALRGTAG